MNEPWIDFAAAGLTADHVGRRITILSPGGLTGRLTSWRPLTGRDAGIAHIDVHGVDEHVRLAARTRVRLHMEDSYDGGPPLNTRQIRRVLRGDAT